VLDVNDQVKRCANCKFHDTVVSNDKTITTLCRRNPPDVLSTFVQGHGGSFNVMQSNVWPQMKPDDWCGSHEPEVLLH
jgi:hypothetical protein